MLITHSMNPQKINKAETPIRKIKHIVTTKNQLISMGLNKIPSNKKLTLNNKENQHPNVRKSPSQEKDKQSIPFHHNERVKENRVKSQYYSSSICTTKQSPIKKILFVKNICYKSNKTSKNSSLDNKSHEPTSSSQQKYLSLNRNQNIEKVNEFDKEEAYERKLHSQGNKQFPQNQSRICQQEKVNGKNIQQFRAKDNILQSQSQANYRMTIAPNELHPKVAQFNQKYSSCQNPNQLKPSLPRQNSFDCSASENIYAKQMINQKMCPNIQSSDLSELESFKKNNFLFPQQKKQTIKALISVDKEKKQSLSSKKRNSRIKINYKNAEKFKQSFNEDFVTQQSEIAISSPSHPIFDQSIKLYNSPNLESERERDSKASMSKNAFEQSTLIETKKVNETFNLSEEFSKITLNESKQSHIENSEQKKYDGKKYCANHPQKLAKYHLNKNIDKPYYCKKCTANIISLQGCQVIEKFNFCENERLQKLNNFISRLQIYAPKLSKSKISVSALQQQANKIMKKAQEQIQNYYKKLHETLDSHKENIIKALHFHSQKTFSEISKLRKTINCNEQELSFMKSDILPNINMIIDEDKLSQESFKQIISEDQLKLENIEALVQQISDLVEGKQNKIAMKTVEIPTTELQSAFNILERTQIVFTQKVVKINPKESYANHAHNASIKCQQNDIQALKKDFSFDDQNIDTSFYVPSSKKKDRKEGTIIQNFYELTDSIRLSFGNKFEMNPSPLKSPTFKII